MIELLNSHIIFQAYPTFQHRTFRTFRFGKSHFGTDVSSWKHFQVRAPFGTADILADGPFNMGTL